MYIKLNTGPDRLGDKTDERLKCKLDRNLAFLVMILSFVMLAGSLIISRTPSVTNESLRFIAGMVMSVWYLVCGALVISASGFVKHSREYRELCRQFGNDDVCDGSVHERNDG